VNGIDYVVLTPQNKITYSRAFRGNLILASPKEDACDFVKSIPTQGDEAVPNPIVITTWGECAYQQKVRNAENAGAKMVILVLRHDMPFNHPEIRALPLDSTVEVLAVSKTDGDALLQVIREAEQKLKNDPESVIELYYSYDPERNANYEKSADGSVALDYWITPTDESKSSYDFLNEVKGLLSDFGSTLKFRPHYVFWENDLGKGGFNAKDTRCVSGGRYCDADSEIENRLFGRPAVLEALRQICLRDLDDQSNSNTVWWKYMNAYSNECVDADYNANKNCHEKAYRAANIPQSVIDRVESCMRDSFGASASDDLATVDKDNSKLRVELQALKNDRVAHYPSLYVNRGDRYPGSFRNRASLVDFICNHYTTDVYPAICTAGANSLVHTSTDTAVYVAIILASVVFMAIVLYCVRRGVKREVMFKMNDEISHIVTQYKQFKDKSNSSNVDDDL